MIEQEINACCRLIKPEDLEMIMDWRMRPEITRYMNTDPKLTIEGQKKWLQKIQQSETEWSWILEVEGVPAGVVSLGNYDGNKVYTGVYIAVKEKRSLKLTLYLQWNLYRYAFEYLHVNKVCEEIFSENKAVNRMMDMCGSKREGVLRSHICKNGQYYDMVVRGILKEEWDSMKDNLKYDKIVFELKEGTECF
ncbi:MAG: GNAT family N-acetyltransferase [Lachnospiraceae bacterium]